MNIAIGDKIRKYHEGFNDKPIRHTFLEGVVVTQYPELKFRVDRAVLGGYDYQHSYLIGTVEQFRVDQYIQKI